MVFVGFFHMLFQNFARISPEVHTKSPDFNRMSPEFRQNFGRISNWSTFKKRITKTQPSHGSLWTNIIYIYIYIYIYIHIYIYIYTPVWPRAVNGFVLH